MVKTHLCASLKKTQLIPAQSRKTCPKRKIWVLHRNKFPAGLIKIGSTIHSDIWKRYFWKNLPVLTINTTRAVYFFSTKVRIYGLRLSQRLWNILFWTSVYRTSCIYYYKFKSHGEVTWSWKLWPWRKKQLSTIFCYFLYVTWAYTDIIVK